MCMYSTILHTCTHEYAHTTMYSEFGATAAFFPCDAKTMKYLYSTGRDAKNLQLVEKYMRANKLFRLYDDDDLHIKLALRTRILPTRTRTCRPAHALADPHTHFAWRCMCWVVFQILWRRYDAGSRIYSSRYGWTKTAPRFPGCN